MVVFLCSCLFSIKQADNPRNTYSFSVLSALRLCVWLYNSYLLFFNIDYAFLLTLRTEQGKVYQFCIFSNFGSSFVLTNRAKNPFGICHYITSFRILQIIFLKFNSIFICRNPFFYCYPVIVFKQLIFFKRTGQSICGSYIAAIHKLKM